MDIINWLQANYEQVLLIAAGVYGVALHIVALTPTKKDDTVLERIANVVKKFIPSFGAKK